MNLRTSLASLLALAAIATGCTSPAAAPTPTVVAFSDVHFDPFFDPALLPELLATPESEWAGVFARHGTSDPGHYGGTTNFTLLERSLAAIRAQQPRPTLVVFGGDILVQDFSTLYKALVPGADATDIRAFALRTVRFVVHRVRAALGTTPVYFTLGNWDSYGGSFALEPNDPFLADTAALFYEGFLAGTTDRLAFESTYRVGGYYAAEVPGVDLVVVGLNTNFLAPQAPSGIEAAVTHQLDWLDAVLAAVQASGRRAWIVTHVPPGGDLATTGGDVDAQGHVSQPTMMLQAKAQERLLAILEAHRGALAAAFTGHTHMDEYRLAVIAMQGIPGITSLMGNAPAFKTFTVGGDATLQDYASWAMDLSASAPSFQAWYDFSTAYGLAEPLGPSQLALYPLLASSPAAASGYRGRYGSGHAPTKPMTDLNWPVYRCGVAWMGAQGLADCVNGP